jgi:hypothetical protein
LLAAVQRQAGTDYDATAAVVAGQRRYNALNPAVHAEMEFSEEGVRLMPERAHSEVTGPPVAMGLASVGRVGAAVTLTNPVAPVTAHNRVEYRRSKELTEWYVNGPLGLEQGFTFNARPPGEGHLIMELSLREGVDARMSGGDVDLYAQSVAGNPPRPVGRYSDLYVEDASGRMLDARLAVRGSTIVIEVNDSVATYPILVDPLLTLQQLLDGSTFNGGQFGWSVALDSNTAIVGAPSVSSSAGAVYSFTQNGSQWSLTDTILGAANELLGVSVALSGDNLFVGAPGTDGSHNRVYVYTRSSSTSPWVQLQTLTSHDAVCCDYFGFSIAVANNTLLIGATNRNSAAGAAYVFGSAGGNWQEQQELAPSGLQAKDGFANGVALSADGNAALVGAPGYTKARSAAYFFSRTGSTWILSQTVTAGQPTDSFGTSVALAGSTAFVGAPFKNNNAGAVYPYLLQSGTWFQLTEVDGASGEQFGTSVAFDGTTALVGAIGSSKAYVVSTTSPGIWSLQQSLSGSRSGFGQAVAFNAGTNFTALVGATLNGVAGDPGAAYIFGASARCRRWAGEVPLYS